MHQQHLKSLTSTSTKPIFSFTTESKFVAINKIAINLQCEQIRINKLLNYSKEKDYGSYFTVEFS